ncbi:MAG: hypothetical protein M3P39_10895 [Actinomycetota bacterium]|nr:hypothetical protein [Actinomycetota bacterium]
MEFVAEGQHVPLHDLAHPGVEDRRVAHEGALVDRVEPAQGTEEHGESRSARRSRRPATDTAP